MPSDNGTIKLQKLLSCPFPDGPATVGACHALLYLPTSAPHLHAENPRLLHYGLDMEVRNDDDQVVYRWDKAAHHDFDALACPPWDLTEQPARRGLFPHPPLASSISGRVRSVTLASAKKYPHDDANCQAAVVLIACMHVA